MAERIPEKWIANDLSNVDYRAEEYDNSGGAVIVDVMDVPKNLWETENLMT